jgi:hypothetical protein
VAGLVRKLACTAASVRSLSNNWVSSAVTAILSGPYYFTAMRAFTVRRFPA